MKIKSADVYGNDLTESEDHFTVTDVLLAEISVILTVQDLQVDSYKDEEVLIEYTIVNPMSLKVVVDHVFNNEKVHLTKEDLALPIPNLKIGLHNKTDG